MVGLEVPVFPYRRHIFITETITPGSGVPGSKIMVIDFETTFYFHREGAGILFGMSDPDEPSSYNVTVSWEFLEKVTRAAVKRLPVAKTLQKGRDPDRIPPPGPSLRLPCRMLTHPHIDHIAKHQNKTSNPAAPPLYPFSPVQQTFKRRLQSFGVLATTPAPPTLALRVLR
jgi:hypothetical protein